MSPRLLLFTKPAVPGRVKTRLAKVLGEGRAAELHRAFVGDVTTRLETAGGFALELAWALAEGEEPPAWPETSGLPWRRQRGADLGARLWQALDAASRDGEDGEPVRAVAAVGSDHPEMEARRVHEAFARLEDGADLVLGPAADGGYYLIALAPGSVHRRLFSGIAWSTDAVRRQTLERAAELGLRVEELAVGHDVDLAPDLERLVRRLERGGPGDEAVEADCPRTRALLESWGMLAPREATCAS